MNLCGWARIQTCDPWICSEMSYWLCNGAWPPCLSKIKNHGWTRLPSIDFASTGDVGTMYHQYNLAWAYCCQPCVPPPDKSVKAPDEVHFAIKKYWYFSYFSMKHMLWYSLEWPHWLTSKEYPQHNIEGWAKDWSKSDGCFSPNLISSPWRHYEDYHIPFCTQ